MWSESGSPMDDGRSISLGEHLAEAGYAVFDGISMDRVEAALLDAGVCCGGRTVLRTQPPLDTGWSLSERYGYEAFPWHTDGVLAKRPPRYVVLSSTTSSVVPTELVDMAAPGLTDLIRSMAGTVLLIRDRIGRARYALAADSTPPIVSVRWDPRVACIAGGGSNALGSRIEALAADAAVRWTEGRVLIFDNTRLLHRRPSVPSRAHRELVRWYGDEVTTCVG